jgi:cytochrome c oxidase subunit 2
MMAVAFGGLLLVVGIMVAAWFTRRRPHDEQAGERLGTTVVVALGIVMPICVVCALFIVSDTLIINTTQAPAASSTAMTIRAIGHQWWWEFRYPGTGAVTADEMHIPVDTRINLVATTADVIHSFWVPPLNRKIDTIPGQRNRILLYSNELGTFRGQCAEFCGLQHAHMAMYVFAEPRPVFRRWLAREAKPAARPTGALARQGEQLFLGGSCSTCHAIRGTDARGYTGPDLTHLQSRTTLGALTVPNGEGYLARWITDSQHFKPGNQMPDVPLTGRRLRALLAYLRGLG